MSAAVQLAREYELVYILRPNVGPSEAKKVSERIVDVVQKGGAKITRVDNWGKRRLAYQIDKHTRGIFVHVTFVAPSDLVAELERNLRILDSVIRYQTVRLENLYDLSELTVDPSEVEFVEIEESTDDDDDDEPSFEEQLGMSAPRASSRGDDSDDDDSSDDDSSDDDSSDDDSSGDDSSGDDSSGDDSSGDDSSDDNDSDDASDSDEED